MTPKEARIIFGDDDPDVLKSVKYNLELHGHQVVLAFGKVTVGLERFEQAKEKNPHVAILDRSLIDQAGPAGQELIGRCRAANIPILCCTFSKQPDWADLHVHKKEGPRALRETIKKL